MSAAIETVTKDDKKRITALRRRVTKARNFPTNTCPASRHLHIMADCLLKPKKDGSLRYPMLAEEPEHCAESILAVLASLWEARTKLRKYEGEPDTSKGVESLLRSIDLQRKFVK